MTFYVPLPSTGIEYLRKPITNTEKKCQKVSVFHHKLLNLEFWKGDLASYQTYGHKHSVTHLVWPHQPENPPGRPRARRISP